MNNRTTVAALEPDIEENAASGGWILAVLRLIGGIGILTIGSRILVSGAAAPPPIWVSVRR